MLGIGQSRWIRKDKTRARWRGGSCSLNTNQRFQLHIHVADCGLHAACGLSGLLNLVDYSLERVGDVKRRCRRRAAGLQLRLQRIDLGLLLRDLRLQI